MATVDCWDCGEEMEEFEDCENCAFWEDDEEEFED
jgi:hypothetical protein